MTEDELQAIEARANAATAGPWQTESFGDNSDVEVACIRAANGHTVVTTDSNVYTTDVDAVFIAHARQDVPALIAEVRRLRKVMRLVAGRAWRSGADVAVDISNDEWVGSHYYDEECERAMARIMADAVNITDDELE